MGWNREEHKAKAIFYWIATIVLVFVLIGMTVDFINWKEAISMIKEQMPTDAQYQLYNDGGRNNSSYIKSAFRWRGDLRGRVYLFSNEDMEFVDRNVRWNDEPMTISGDFIGSLNKMSGLYFPLEKLEAHKILKNQTGEHKFDIWFYPLSKGVKVYETVYKGQVAVDYKIDDTIINKYKTALERNYKITDSDIAWLKTFTHDELHEYVISFYKEGKVYLLNQKPANFASILDEKIFSQVRYEKVYEEQWTGWRKNADLGIIYKIDGKTYLLVVKDAWYIGCKGGGYVWSFWEN